MSKKLRVGVVGCGMIANAKHLPSIKKYADKNKNLEICAFCDIADNPVRAKAAAEKFGIENAGIYLDYKEMLNKENLDAVHVCTTNKYHAPISIYALNKGVNVICEKPMAINRFEARGMMAAAKASGKILTVGYQNRYRSDSQHLKKMCEAGDFGEIYLAKARGVRRRNVPVWGSFLSKEEQGGGPLIDVGCHALDLALWFMDDYKPKSVLATAFHKIAEQTQTGNEKGDWIPEEFEVEDSAVALITMQNGHTITLDASWALNTLDVGESRCTLCGTKAGADMRDGLRINGVDHNKLYSKKMDIDTTGSGYYGGESVDTHVTEAAIFYDAILGKGQIVVKPEQALMVTEIIDAIYESSKLGKAVYMTDKEW